MLSSRICSVAQSLSGMCIFRILSAACMAWMQSSTRFLHRVLHMIMASCVFYPFFLTHVLASRYREGFGEGLAAPPP